GCLDGRRGGSAFQSKTGRRRRGPVIGKQSKSQRRYNADRNRLPRTAHEISDDTTNHAIAKRGIKTQERLKTNGKRKVFKRKKGSAFLFQIYRKIENQ